MFNGFLTLTSGQQHQEGYVDDFLGQHGTTMNGKYYANLLKQVRQTRRNAAGKSMHQDNAPVHTSRVAMDAVRECGYELLPHILQT